MTLIAKIPLTLTGCALAIIPGPGPRLSKTRAGFAEGVKVLTEWVGGRTRATDEI